MAAKVVVGWASEMAVGAALATGVELVAAGREVVAWVVVATAEAATAVMVAYVVALVEREVAVRATPARSRSESRHLSYHTMY